MTERFTSENLSSQKLKNRLGVNYDFSSAEACRRAGNLAGQMRMMEVLERQEDARQLAEDDEKLQARAGQLENDTKLEREQQQYRQRAQQVLPIPGQQTVPYGQQASSYGQQQSPQYGEQQSPQYGQQQSPRYGQQQSPQSGHVQHPTYAQAPFSPPRRSNTHCSFHSDGGCNASCSCYPQ
jgi:DNA primase